MVQTTRMAGMAGGSWEITMAYGCLADPQALPNARQALEHMVATCQVSPQWQEMQMAAGRAAQQGTWERSQIMRDAQNQIGEMRTQSWWNTQRTQDNAMRNWSNGMRGTADVVDPWTGEQFRTWDNGSPYVWRRNGTNELTQTNGENPGSDWTQVRRW
jgi:hypothetical protein